MRMLVAGSVPALTSRRRYRNWSPGLTRAMHGYAVYTVPSVPVRAGQVGPPTATGTAVRVLYQPSDDVPETHLRALNAAPPLTVTDALAVQYVPAPKAPSV